MLLDIVKYYEQIGHVIDPWATTPISVEDLEGCAKAQGISFRQGDILLLRVGFIKKYNASTQEDKDAVAGRPEAL